MGLGERKVRGQERRELEKPRTSALLPARAGKSLALCLPAEADHNPANESGNGLRNNVAGGYCIQQLPISVRLKLIIFSLPKQTT